MVSLMKDIGLERFKKEFAGSPKLLGYLEANFESAAAPEWVALTEAVDESDFSLRDWVESLIVMAHWLDSRGLELPMRDQIGYVCCSGDSAGAGSNLEHLPGLVEAMLKQYGCERAERK